MGPLFLVGLGYSERGFAASNSPCKELWTIYNRARVCKLEYHFLFILKYSSRESFGVLLNGVGESGGWPAEFGGDSLTCTMSCGDQHGIPRQL
jgi:hypothetical protein